VGAWGVKMKKRKICNEPTRRSIRLADADVGGHSPPPCGTLSPLAQETPRPPDLIPHVLLVTDHVAASSTVAALIPESHVDIENEFLDSQENFQEPKTWWHGRDSSCKGESDSDEGDNYDIEMEGGGLEEMLTWPPELLFQCEDHARPRRNGGRKSCNLASGSRDADAIANDHGRIEDLAAGGSDGACTVGRGNERGQCSGAQFNDEGHWGSPGRGEAHVGTGLQLPKEIPAEGGTAWPGWQGLAVGDTVGMGPDFVAMDIGSTNNDCLDFGGCNAQYIALTLGDAMHSTLPQ
jgi:hypothetical protein